MLPIRVSKCFVYPFLMAALLTFAGCHIKDRKTLYEVSDLNIRVIQDEYTQNTYVIFSALMETQFYSPGAKVTTSEKKVFLEFVRAGIQDKGVQIDLKAPFLATLMEGRDLPPVLREHLTINPQSADQVLVLPPHVSAIYVKGGNGEKLVWEKR